MNEDFPNAAKRHWIDGKLLHEQERLDNADQLYGFAAECALKYVLVSLGHFSPETHRRHINELWNRMQTTAFHNRFPGLARFLSGQNPFADWAIEQRYLGEGNISKTAICNHQKSVRRILIATSLYRG